MTLEESITKIESFKTLKYGWNGYEAEPISDIVIIKAIHLVIQGLQDIQDIFPTARNSIQIELKYGGYSEIEVFSDRYETYTEC